MSWQDILISAILIVTILTIQIRGMIWERKYGAKYIYTRKLKEEKKRRECAKYLKWTKVKPTKPCLFLTRDHYKDHYDYQVWQLKWSYGFDEKGKPLKYLAILSWCEEEYGTLEDFDADEYLVVKEYDGNGGKNETH